MENNQSEINKNLSIKNFNELLVERRQSKEPKAFNILDKSLVDNSQKLEESLKRNKNTNTAKIQFDQPDNDTTYRQIEQNFTKNKLFIKPNQPTSLDKILKLPQISNILPQKAFNESYIQEYANISSDLSFKIHDNPLISSRRYTKHDRICSFSSLKDNQILFRSKRPLNDDDDNINNLIFQQSRCQTPHKIIDMVSERKGYDQFREYNDLERSKSVMNVHFSRFPLLPNYVTNENRFMRRRLPLRRYEISMNDHHNNDIINSNHLAKNQDYSIQNILSNWMLNENLNSSKSIDQIKKANILMKRCSEPNPYLEWPKESILNELDKDFILRKDMYGIEETENWNLNSNKVNTERIIDKENHQVLPTRRKNLLANRILGQIQQNALEKANKNDYTSKSKPIIDESKNKSRAFSRSKLFRTDQKKQVSEKVYENNGSYNSIDYTKPNMGCCLVQNNQSRLGMNKEIKDIRDDAIESTLINQIPSSGIKTSYPRKFRQSSQQDKDKDRLEFLRSGSLNVSNERQSKLNKQNESLSLVNEHRMAKNEESNTMNGKILILLQVNETNVCQEVSSFEKFSAKGVISKANELENTRKAEVYLGNYQEQSNDSSTLHPKANLVNSESSSYTTNILGQSTDASLHKKATILIQSRSSSHLEDNNTNTNNTGHIDHQEPYKHIKSTFSKTAKTIQQTELNNNILVHNDNDSIVDKKKDSFDLLNTEISNKNTMGNELLQDASFLSKLKTLTSMLSYNLSPSISARQCDSLDNIDENDNSRINDQIQVDFINKTPEKHYELTEKSLQNEFEKIISNRENSSSSPPQLKNKTNKEDIHEAEFDHSTHKDQKSKLKDFLKKSFEYNGVLGLEVKSAEAPSLSLQNSTKELNNELCSKSKKAMNDKFHKDELAFTKEKNLRRSSVADFRLKLMKVEIDDNHHDDGDDLVHHESVKDHSKTKQKVMMEPNKELLVSPTSTHVLLENKGCRDSLNPKNQGFDSDIRAKSPNSKEELNNGLCAKSNPREASCKQLQPKSNQYLNSESKKLPSQELEVLKCRENLKIDPPQLKLHKINNENHASSISEKINPNDAIYPQGGTTTINNSLTSRFLTHRSYKFPFKESLNSMNMPKSDQKANKILR